MAEWDDKHLVGCLMLNQHHTFVLLVGQIVEGVLLGLVVVLIGSNEYNTLNQSRPLCCKKIIIVFGYFRFFLYSSSVLIRLP